VEGRVRSRNIIEKEIAFFISIRFDDFNNSIQNYNKRDYHVNYYRFIDFNVSIGNLSSHVVHENRDIKSSSLIA